MTEWPDATSTAEPSDRTPAAEPSDRTPAAESSDGAPAAAPADRRAPVESDDRGAPAAPSDEVPPGSSDPGDPSRWRAFRSGVAARPTLNLAYRIGVAVIGVAVLILGIVAIPYPGPGWAIVFAGLGILATEFAWAKIALGWLRDRYRQGMAWYSARGPAMRVAAATVTFALVVATLWLLGTFGLIGGWIGVESAWLRSPLAW